MIVDCHFNYWNMDERETYDNSNGMCVRAWVINQTDIKKENFCAIQVSDGKEITNHYFKTQREMVAAVRAIMWGVIVKVDEEFSEMINQAERDCIITEVKKTRFRVGYEMPNAGWMEGWRTVTFIRNGVKYYIEKD